MGRSRLPVKLGAALQIDTENPAGDCLEERVTPTDLGMIEHQVRPWITTDEKKWTVKTVLRRTDIRLPSASHSNDNGVFSPQARRNNSKGDSGMTEINSKEQPAQDANRRWKHFHHTMAPASNSTRPISILTAVTRRGRADRKQSRTVSIPVHALILFIMH